MTAGGVFVALEGPEGSGKSTQTARLVARLQEEGCEVVSVHEPGGTPTGEAIRDILQHDKAQEQMFPEAEALLFASSRAQLVRRVIRPALENGKCIVCDRFADSTTVYQGYGRGLDVEKMMDINDFATGDTVPGLTIILDIDVKLGFERLNKRIEEQNAKPDRFELEEMSFHEKVRGGYLELAKRYPDRIKIIDASRDEESVATEVWGFVKELLEKKF